MGKVVRTLRARGLATKVGLERRVNLLGGELTAHAESAKVIGVVAHAGVLPVDEVVLLPHR